MATYGRNGVVQLADHSAIAPAAGVNDDVQSLDLSLSMMRVTESMILALAWTMAMQLLLNLLSRYRLLRRYLRRRCRYKDSIYLSRMQ
jgi:hypothetical protein